MDQNQLTRIKGIDYTLASLSSSDKVEFAEQA